MRCHGLGPAQAAAARRMAPLLAPPPTPPPTPPTQGDERLEAGVALLQRLRLRVQLHIVPLHGSQGVAWGWGWGEGDEQEPMAWWLRRIATCLDPSLTPSLTVADVAEGKVQVPAGGA